MTTINPDKPFYNEISDGTNFVSTFVSDPRNHFGEFGKGYFLAASQMAERLITQSNFSDYEAYPVVFLYRHAFELYLKNILYKALPLAAFRKIEDMNSQLHNTHKLVPLANKVIIVIRQLFPDDSNLNQVAMRIKRTAEEFSIIDPDSYSYRYPIDTDGNPSTPKNQTVNLRAFANMMSIILTAMESINFGFDIETYQAQEIWDLLQSQQEG